MTKNSITFIPYPMYTYHSYILPKNHLPLRRNNSLLTCDFKIIGTIWSFDCVSNTDTVFISINEMNEWMNKWMNFNKWNNLIEFSQQTIYLDSTVITPPINYATSEHLLVSLPPFPFLLKGENNRTGVTQMELVI
jgi:hypothetical protein